MRPKFWTQMLQVGCYRVNLRRLPPVSIAQLFVLRQKKGASDVYTSSRDGREIMCGREQKGKGIKRINQLSSGGILKRINAEKEEIPVREDLPQ